MNENPIQSFIHCRRCVSEVPEGESPASYARLVVGITETHGIAVWCNRHDQLVGVLGHSHIHAPKCEKCEEPS